MPLCRCLLAEILCKLAMPLPGGRGSGRLRAGARSGRARGRFLYHSRLAPPRLWAGDGYRSHAQAPRLMAGRHQGWKRAGQGIWSKAIAADRAQAVRHGLDEEGLLYRFSIAELGIASRGTGHFHPAHCVKQCRRRSRGQQKSAPAYSPSHRKAVSGSRVSINPLNAGKWYRCITFLTARKSRFAASRQPMSPKSVS